jgi:hypothetical protein
MNSNVYVFLPDNLKNWMCADYKPKELAAAGHSSVRGTGYSSFQKTLFFIPKNILKQGGELEILCFLWMGCARRHWGRGWMRTSLRILT